MRFGALIFVSNYFELMSRLYLNQIESFDLIRVVRLLGGILREPWFQFWLSLDQIFDFPSSTIEDGKKIQTWVFEVEQVVIACSVDTVVCAHVCLGISTSPRKFARGYNSCIAMHSECNCNCIFFCFFPWSRHHKRAGQLSTGAEQGSERQGRGWCRWCVRQLSQETKPSPGWALV